MAKYGFLSALEEEMDKHFQYDYAMDWDKKNHAVEVTFVLEAQNKEAIKTIDDSGEVTQDDIVFEDYVLFTTLPSLNLMQQIIWLLFLLTPKGLFS